MAASPATQGRTPRDFQRNDVVHDASRPDEPPGVVLGVYGGSVTLRLPEQPRGATRVVKPKVADVEVAPRTTTAGHGTTPVTPAAAHAPGEAAKPFRHGDRAVVQEGGVTRPVRIVKVGGRTATVVFTDQPAVPGGASKVDVQRLQRPDPVVELATLANSSARLQAGNTGPSITATERGSGLRERAEATHVEIASARTSFTDQSVPLALRQPETSEGLTFATTRIRPRSNTASNEPGGADTGFVAIGASRIPQETAELLADPWALRSEQRRLSTHYSPKALKTVAGSEQFREISNLLKTDEGRNVANSLLKKREHSSSPVFQAPRTEEVPLVQNGEFTRWFDETAADELERIWKHSDRGLRDKVED